MSGMYLYFLLGFGVLIFSVMISKDASGVEIDPDFKPALLKTELIASEVMPGDRIGLTFKFINEGTRAAQGDYTVFLHFEYPDFDCRNIKIHSDHAPTLPTSAWQPGMVVVDGPYTISLPADLPEGEYHIHTGIYAPKSDGARLLDVKAGTITIAKSAVSSAELNPEPMPKSEVSGRRIELWKRVKNSVALETRDYSFAMDRDSGAFQLVDRRTGILWASNPESTWFGAVQLGDGQSQYTTNIVKFDSIVEIEDGLKASVELAVNDQPVDIALNVFIEAISSEPVGIRFRYDTEAKDEANKWHVRSVRLLDKAFWTTDADDGYAIVPLRLGEMLPTDSGLPATRRYLTYSDSTMALYGAVKQGSALLMAWPHPDTELEVRTTWPDLPLVGGRRMHSASIVLKGEAREFSVHPLGKGTYVDIGRAYRPIARRNGWLATWSEKRNKYPSVDQMFGAADFKPFVFSRTIPSSRFSTSDREQTSMPYTFEEAAQVAEHLHNDLGIDKAMYVLAGWINRGYDNQHPDVLPAAPECGGNDALIDCAKRVRDCGFLFGLHDNYQDMYEDAASWNVEYLNKNIKQEPKMGGNWAGGQAWQVCAIHQVTLAERLETNLPEIARLFGPTIYFIDTTFAWPLVTCEATEHPMTRSDDMEWKSRLCDVSKEYFGLFGSEEGREWAIPHADYMEGLLSHKLKADRPDRGFSRHGDGVVIPMFELIYGDCINLYGHQGDRATLDRPDYILNCLIYAEMPVYHFGGHLYYERKAQPITVEIGKFEQTGDRTFQITYNWKANGDVNEDYRCFVHFTHPEGERNRENIAFQDDHELPIPSSIWRTGDVIMDGPRRIEIPQKYQGKCDIWIGLSNINGERQELADLFSLGGRYYIGSIEINDGKITPGKAAPPKNNRCFARADNGWAKNLNETDRLIKNTYEVLSWVNRLTAETPMTDHKFLTDDMSVEWSQFDNVQIWVNYGSEPYTVPLPYSEAVMPQYGFLAISPTFAAIHATSFGGLDYEAPVLFTARSLDGKSLAESREIRIYHGFGDDRIMLMGREFRVEDEKIVTTE